MQGAAAAIANPEILANLACRKMFFLSKVFFQKYKI